MNMSVVVARNIHSDSYMVPPGGDATRSTRSSCRCCSPIAGLSSIVVSQTGTVPLLFMTLFSASGSTPTKSNNRKHAVKVFREGFGGLHVRAWQALREFCRLPSDAVEFMRCLRRTCILVAFSKQRCRVPCRIRPRDHLNISASLQPQVFGIHLVVGFGTKRSDPYVYVAFGAACRTKTTQPV